jgi:hypothetical protein
MDVGENPTNADLAQMYPGVASDEALVRYNSDRATLLGTPLPAGDPAPNPTTSTSTTSSTAATDALLGDFKDYGTSPTPDQLKALYPGALDLAMAKASYAADRKLYLETHPEVIPVTTTPSAPPVTNTTPPVTTPTSAPSLASPDFKDVGANPTPSQLKAMYPDAMDAAAARNLYTADRASYLASHPVVTPPTPTPAPPPTTPVVPEGMVVVPQTSATPAQDQLKSMGYWPNLPKQQPPYPELITKFNMEDTPDNRNLVGRMYVDLVLKANAGH